MSEAHRDEIAKLEALYSERPEGRVFTHLAEAYRKAGEPERALEILNEGLERHEGYASAHVVRGRTLQDVDRVDEAVAAFERVLELDAQNLVALRGLAELANGRGDVERAMEYYERVVELDPSDEDVLATLESLRRERPAGMGAGMASGEAESEAMVAPQEPAGGGAEPPADEDTGGPETGEMAEADLGSLEDWDTGVEDEDDAIAPQGAGAGVEEPMVEEPGVEEPVDLSELPDAGGAVGMERHDVTGEGPDEHGGADVPGVGIDAGGIEGAGPADREDEDDGAVVTETMADVYARQGLYTQAVEVYERLLRQQPDEERLRGKLQEARAALADAEESSAEGGADAAEVGAQVEGAGTAALDTSPVEEAGGEEGWDEPVQEPEGFEAAVFRPPEADELETPGAGDAEEPEDMDGLEADASGADVGVVGDVGIDEAEPVEGLETGEFEASATPDEVEGVEIEGLETMEPGLDVGGPTVDEEAAAEPEEPVDTVAEPVEGLEAATFEPPPEEESFEPPPEEESFETEQGVEPGPMEEAAEGAEPEPEAEMVESAWTGAGGAAGDEESPYAWAAEAQDATADAEAQEDTDQPAIRSYLSGLVGWQSSRALEPQPPDAPSQAPSPRDPPAPEPSGAEPPSPEASGTGPPSPEPSGSPLEGAEADEALEGADDEDLDMFRSWLDNLKQ